MSHKKRGYALIFNQENFDRMDSRPGTDVDCENLHKTLTGLRFKVIVYKDYRRAEIKSVIKEISSEDHTENDCIVIAILSHGEDGAVFAADREYSHQSLFSYFTGDRCPTLAGKPKLFFTQACCGDAVDLGVLVSHGNPTPQVYYDKLPVQADFLFGYSTVPGYVSYRNTGQGSWYIKTLCEQLRMNGTRYDLMKLLTNVNHKVATEFEAFHQQNRISLKQMPIIVSTLRKSLKFTDNNVTQTERLLID